MDDIWCYSTTVYSSELGLEDESTLFLLPSEGSLTFAVEATMILVQSDEITVYGSVGQPISSVQYKQ